VAVEQEILEIVHRFLGGEEVARAIAREEQELRGLQAALQAGAIGFDEFERESEQVIGNLNELRASTTVTVTTLEGLGQAATRTGRAKRELAGEADKLRKSVGKDNLGLGFLELSRAFEDAQYGLRGVLNNIPQAVQLFGGPAGLAAAASATAVSISILGPKIIELLNDFDDARLALFGKGLDDIKEKIKFLEEKPHKIEVDFQRLGDARKELEVLEARLKAFESAADRTTEQEKAAKAAAEAIQEYGGTKVGAAKGLAAVAGPEIEPTTPAGRRLGEARAELTRLEKVTPETYEEQVALVERREALRDEIAALPTLIKKQVQELVEARVGAALRGEQAAIAELRRAFEQRPEPFLQAGAQPLFGFALGQATLPEIRGREEEKQEIARQERMNRLRAQLEKKRGDAVEKATAEAERAHAKQEQDRDKAEREAGAAARAAETERKQRNQQIKQELDQLQKGIAPAGLDERAALRAAELRTPGALLDQFGRPQRITPVQAQLRLRSEIGQELQQARPDLTRPQVAGLTELIAQQANRKAEAVQGQQRLAIAQQARAQGQTLRAGELNVMATQRTLMLLQALIPRVEAVEQAAMVNLRRAEQMQARTKPAARRAR
jgi:hypothetical protein